MSDLRVLSTLVIKNGEGPFVITSWDDTFARVSGIPKEINEVSENSIPSNELKNALKKVMSEGRAVFPMMGMEVEAVSRKMSGNHMLVFFSEHQSVQENDLWNSELSSLKLLAEKTNDGLWLMDKNLRTVYMSPVIKDYMGYTPEEYMTMPIQERLPAESIKIYQDQYQKLLKQFSENPANDSIIFELPHRHKNGNIYWGEVSVRIIHKQGTIVGFAGVTRNTDEKHRLQEEVIRSNAYYRAILDGFTGLVYVCNEEYRVEFMNEAFVKRTGRNAVGELCHKALHNLDEKCSFCVNERVLKNREKVEWEVQSPFDNRWYHVINVPLELGEGKISKLSLIQDVTEKKLSLEKLNESEELFRKLAEYSPSAIFIYQGAKFVYANPGLERLTGYTNEELLSMNFWDVVGPEFREMVKQRGLNRQTGEHIENRYEFTIITKDGKTKWIDFAGSLIQFKGQPAAIGSAFDITKIKVIEADIRKSEERYRNLIELAADGIVVFDKQGILLDVNTRIEEIFGFSKEEMIGRNFAEFMARGQIDKKPPRFDLLNQNQTVIDERTYIKSDGSELIIETHAKKMPDDTYQVFVRDISGRRKMEKDLARSEEHFRSLIELAVDGIVLGDPEGVIVGANQRFFEICGKKPEQVIGQHIRHLFPDDVLNEKPLRFDVLKTGQPLTNERVMMKPDGEKVYIEMHSKMMPDKTYQSIMRDITERKLTEKALIHSRNLFNTVFEKTQNPIFIINEKGYYTDLNNAAAVFLERPKDKIIGIHVTDTIPADCDATESMTIHRQLWEVGGMAETYYDVNGTTKTLLLTISPVIFENQWHIFGIGTDITDQKKYLKALTENEEKFRQMSENIADGVTIIENNQVVYVNTRLSEITGYPVEELKKMTGFELAASWEKDRIKEIHKTQKGNKEFTNLEYCIQTKNGEERYLLNRYSYGNGNNRKYIITTDITERKQFEKELLQKNEEYRKLNEELQVSIVKARESDRLKSAFIANMSHEIRTPLNAIMGFSEMLSKKELPREKVTNYSQVIHRSGSHLLNLVSDIIDISKIETGQMDVSFEPVNLNQLFAETYSVFEHMAREKQLVFKTDIPAEEYDIVGDRTKLQQILNNLIGNSLKFTEFGEVRFGFSVKNNKLRIVVSDSGIGIANKDIPVIFERFRQIESMPGKKYPGTGLGLAIVKGLTELMKGTIEVKSALGHGTEFVLKFNIEFTGNDQQLKKSLDVAEGSSFHFTGKTLLLAEDETLSQMLFAEILQPTGIQIIEAGDGREALELFVRHKPDIVVLDLGLPRMDGIQVCREIRKTDTNTPVIACSAYAYSTDKEKAMRAGCNDFVTKPYQSDQLLMLIQQFLKNGGGNQK